MDEWQEHIKIWQQKIKEQGEAWVKAHPDWSENHTVYFDFGGYPFTEYTILHGITEFDEAYKVHKKFTAEISTVDSVPEKDKGLVIDLQILKGYGDRYFTRNSIGGSFCIPANKAINTCLFEEMKAARAHKGGQLEYWPVTYNPF